MDFWLSTLALLVAAIVTAYLGRHFNRDLMKSNHQWEEHRYLAISGEKFCDELLGHMVRYPQEGSFDAREVILSGHINVSIQLIAQFIKEHFTHDNDIKNIFRSLVSVTNHRTPETPPDHGWIAESTGLIIELRFAFLGSKPAHNPYGD